MCLLNCYRCIYGNVQSSLFISCYVYLNGGLFYVIPFFSSTSSRIGAWLCIFTQRKDDSFARSVSNSIHWLSFATTCESVYSSHSRLNRYIRSCMFTYMPKPWAKGHEFNCQRRRFHLPLSRVRSFR